MRKIFCILTALLFVAVGLTAQVNVTFRVNMTNAGGFNPAVHKVYMSGASNQSSSGIGALPAWPVPGNEPGFLMSGPVAGGYYTLTITGVMPGEYAYKYFLVENNQPTWGLGEWGGNPNRLVSVGSTDLMVSNTWAQLADNAEIDLVINEIMASNANTISDEDGDYPDWIEIYNRGAGAVNLNGFGLSDNVSNPFKWTFPSVTIFPGQYLLVWASGKDRAEPGKPLHTAFSISASGEPVLLSDPDTMLLYMIPAREHRTDFSYGRIPDGTGELAYMSTPTPGWSNTGPSYSFFLQPVSFSQPDGFYNAPFNLTLLSPDQGVTIRYTMDGSEPTPASPVYQDPLNIAGRAGVPNTISMIPTNNNPDPGPPYFEGWQPPAGEVFKINVVRARAFHPDAPKSETATYSYLIDSQGNGRYSLPVFSLATTPANLFDNEIGMYVHGTSGPIPNFFQDGWERPATLTFFEKGGSFAFKEDIGIRLNGNTTRSRPRKSFRIVAKGEYGNSWINYQLFPDKKTDMYKRFILRNSGNDWDFAIFRDGLFQYLAKQMHVETQYYLPAILFINGEYWGIHNIRDKYDHRYIFAKYGIEEQEMTILGDNSVFKWGNPDGKAHYDQMVDFIRNNNMQTSSNFNRIKEMMDVESFIDYQLLHIFVKNTDWPGNNALYWRYHRDGFAPGEGVKDGRWRWMILDTDFGFDLPFFYVPGLDQGAAHNTLNFATDPSGPNWPNPEWSTLILRRLLQNSDFKNQLINRYCDLLNSTFRPAHVVSMIDSVAGLLNPEMQEHINRWRRPTSLQEWNENVQVLRNFGNARASYQFQHLQQKFNPGSPVNLTVNVSHSSHGYVKVNTIDIHKKTMGVSGDPYPWQGTYFTGVPVVLEAHALPGYVFSHWSGGATGNSNPVTLNLSSHSAITANYITSEEEQLIHFCFFGNSIPNDTPLESLDATFTQHPGARIDYQSALAGYPFAIGDPSWRKASMERRNSPTELNYLPQGNNNTPFAEAGMRGLQIKQPFTGNGGENTLIIRASTAGFKDIKLRFAARDEGAANGIVIDYSTSDPDNWTTTGMGSSTFALGSDYQLYTADFSQITEVSGNPELSVRLRFTGTNMTTDEGNRVTFNNISITGLVIPVNTWEESQKDPALTIFPNPAYENITIDGLSPGSRVHIHDATGRLIISTQESAIDVSGLTQGVYLVRVVERDGRVRTGRFVKK